MAQWASREFSDPELPKFRPRPADGTRLDQILADLKARTSDAPRRTDSAPARNVTPLYAPFRSEIQTLQSSIDQLAEKMDTHRFADAIAELAEKINLLHADRSLGEAEMRLLRSIRRSLDDLIYHMNVVPPQTESDGEPVADAPHDEAPARAAPVFGRRTHPIRNSPIPGPIATPRIEPARNRQSLGDRRPWPGTQFVRQHPWASVAAAAMFAILLAQSTAHFIPRLSDITGSVRPSAPKPQQSAAAVPDNGLAPQSAQPRPDYVPNYIQAPVQPALSSPPAAPAPMAAVTPAPQTTTLASRPAEEIVGLAAYQSGVRLADGPARDYRGAIQMFEKAGDMPAAQFRLALLYERGQGAAKNPAMARALYQKAAERGHVRAMHNLGVLYADGIDGKPDYMMAAEWFRRAAEYGLRDSAYNLATLTARGLGVERKPAIAYMWFALAAQQGDADAARQRDEIGKTLDAAALRSAKAATEAFRPKSIDLTVNQLNTPT